jgi:hypothetical protein
MKRMVSVAFLILAVFAVAKAMARQAPPTLPSAGAPLMTEGQRRSSGLPISHAWMVRERARLRTNEPSLWQVYHVPPRRSVTTDDGLAHGSPDGSLRVSAQLARRPEAIAAWKNEATFIFEPVPIDESKPNGPAVRQLLSLSTEPRALDIWVDVPEGRLTSLPELPGRGRLAGFAGTPLGPMALTAEDDGALEGGAKRWLLRLLGKAGWAECAIPAGAKELSNLTLLADGAGVSLVGVGTRTVEWWRGRVEGEGFVWESMSRPLGGPVDAELGPESAVRSVFLVIRGSLFAISPVNEANWSSVRVFELDPAGPRLVSTVTGSRGAIGILPMEGLSRVAMVWDAGPTAPIAEQRLTVTEVSLWTGRTLFSGPHVIAGPLTRSDAVMLGVMLFVIAASVIVFVMRSDTVSEVTLPPGLSLADPSRRFLASMIDGGIAIVVASRIIDLPLSEVFSVEAAVGAQPVKLMFTSMGIAFVHTTLSEVLFSRSIGKALMGCFVVKLPKTPDATKPHEGVTRVTFGAALVRNAIKWGMPPVVALTFLEPSRRHRAELLTRTAVVVPIPDPSEPGESDDEG